MRLNKRILFQVTKLRGLLANMEKEQEVTRKSFDRTKGQIDNLTRERDLVRKELQKMSKQHDDLCEQALLHEQQIRNLDNELKQNTAMLQKQREIIKKTERDRDKLNEENQHLLSRTEKYKGTVYFE